MLATNSINQEISILTTEIHADLVKQLEHSEAAVAALEVQIVDHTQATIDFLVDLVPHIKDCLNRHQLLLEEREKRRKLAHLGKKARLPVHEQIRHLDEDEMMMVELKIYQLLSDGMELKDFVKLMEERQSSH